MTTTLTLRPREIEAGDRLLDQPGAVVLSVELPTAPAVVATILTTTGPRWAGIDAELEIER